MVKSPFPQNIKHIAIIAPAGPAKPEDIQRASDILGSLGVKATVMPNVFCGSDAKYLSANIDGRVSDIHACWKDESVDLIFCARGGFGSAHLLSSIDWSLLRSREIPLLGFSDITALHLAMLKMGVGAPIASYTAKDLKDMIEDDYTAEALKRALFGRGNELKEFMLPAGRRLKTLKQGSISAPVIPANLTVLASMAGTAFIPDMSGMILLLEDINEPVYKLDRCLTQLAQANVLNRCSGLIFGSFYGCGNAKDREMLYMETARSINGPVFSGFPFGHSLPFAALKVGAEITISKDGRILCWTQK